MLCSIGGDLLPIMFTSGSEHSSLIFPFLIITLLPLGASYIFGTLITAQGDLRFLNKISLLAIGVNVVLNFLLIPIHGIWGAAVATLATQSFVSIIQWRHAVSKFNLIYSISHYVKIILFILVLIGLAVILELANLKWEWKPIIILASGIILSIILKLVRASDFKELKNYQRS